MKAHGMSKLCSRTRSEECTAVTSFTTPPSELNATDSWSTCAWKHFLIYTCTFYVKAPPSPPQFYNYYGQPDVPQQLWKICSCIKRRDLTNAFTSSENCSMMLAHIYTTNYMSGDTSPQHSWWIHNSHSWEFFSIYHWSFQQALNWDCTSNTENSALVG